MKLNTKAIKELMQAGCEYDEAVRLVQNGVRLKRVKEKRSKRGKRSYRRTRTQE